MPSYLNDKKNHGKTALNPTKQNLVVNPTTPPNTKKKISSTCKGKINFSSVLGQSCITSRKNRVCHLFLELVSSESSIKQKRISATLIPYDEDNFIYLFIFNVIKKEARRIQCNNIIMKMYAKLHLAQQSAFDWK